MCLDIKQMIQQVLNGVGAAGARRGRKEARRETARANSVGGKIVLVVSSTE